MTMEVNRTLSRFPRVPLAALPTALEKLDKFGQDVGFKNLWMKRDDNTGLALGGNKARKLEFLVADAQAQGCDTILTLGGVQSNHCRMTAAAARKYGMECYLWLFGNPPENTTGNVLLDKILGAKYEFMPMLSDEEILPRVDGFFEQLRTQGKKPYYIPIGGSNAVGALGYVTMVQELMVQCEQQGITPDTIVLTTGSGGTQSGTVLGCKLFSPKTRVIGISVGRSKAYFEAKVLQDIRDTEKLLGIEPVVTPHDVVVYEEYIGEKYGVPTEGAIQSIGLLAQTEGILLDPVYTGKTMAGMIDLRQRGLIRPDETVVFIHTGGVPAIFAYESWF